MTCRRCVGCGRTAPKHELLRIALEPRASGRPRVAVLDPQAQLPGRGAYLCRLAVADGDVPAPACLTRAVKRRAFARALRATVSLDPKLVESVAR